MKWQPLATDYDTTAEATDGLASAGLGELIESDRFDLDRLVLVEAVQ